jgi:hypothetical protein
MKKTARKAAPPKATREESEWFTLVQCSGIFGVTRAVFHQTYRPLIPADSIRDIDGRITIRPRGLIDAMVSRERAKVHQSPANEDDALVFSGGDSPNLERLRGAKATLAEMDLEERRGSHANIKHLDTCLMRFASQIRRGGEILQRKFGNEASDVLNSAVIDAEQLIKEEIQKFANDIADNSDQPKD